MRIPWVWLGAVVFGAATFGELAAGAGEPEPPLPTATTAVLETVVFSDHAEGGCGNWDRYDADAGGVPSLEYWGWTNHQVISGNASFYASRCNYAAGVETCNNGLGHIYAGQMDARMVLTDAQAFDLSGYDHGVLQYSYLVHTLEDDAFDDYLTHWTNEEGMVASPVIPSGILPPAGQIGWSIGNTATKIGFTFRSNDDAERGHGAFVDDIVVSGATEVGEGDTFEAGDPELVMDGTGSQPVSDSAPITTYEWHFSDGGSASGPVVRHTFPGLGLYRVDLTVTDLAMNQDTTHMFVHVVPEPATVAMVALGAAGVALRRRR
jgi:hypothetical protein